jgi:nucleotide-binding universal stress UspA family protein
MKRILAATDGSANSARAVDVAAGLARELGGSLKIVNIIGDDAPTPDALRELARQEHLPTREFLVVLSDQCLAAARARAELLGVSGVQIESKTGDIAMSIIDIARRDQADAIVLGKRGLGRLAGLVLGSVSQKVVSHADCAVIVVP